MRMQFCTFIDIVPGQKNVSKLKIIFRLLSFELTDIRNWNLQKKKEVSPVIFLNTAIIFSRSSYNARAIIYKFIKPQLQTIPQRQQTEELNGFLDKNATTCSSQQFSFCLAVVAKVEGSWYGSDD